MSEQELLLQHLELLTTMLTKKWQRFLVEKIDKGLHILV